jgi:thiol-disulfide isomerase/thioredoxin
VTVENTKEGLAGFTVVARNKAFVGDRFRTKTEADGTYRLPVPAGDVWFTFREAQNRSLSVKPGQTIDGVDFVAEAEDSSGNEVVLRLLDPNGLPVRGVKVGRHLSTHSDARGRNLVGFYSAQSDEKGLVSFQKNDLFQGRNQDERSLLYALEASQELAGFLEISSDRCDEVIDWKLQPACKVSGRLESSSLEKLGQELEWTNVYVYKDNHRPLSYNSKTREFEFYLPPGFYKLNAYGTSVYSINRDVEIQSGQRELSVTLDLPADRLAELKGQTAPEFRRIKGWINSEPLTLADLRGKFVLLDFWGYWCGPCLSAMPDLMTFHDKLSKYGLTIIAIHDDSLGTVEELQEKLKDLSEKRWSGRPIPFAVALDGGGETKIDGTDRSARGATTAAYGIQGWPTSILIDKKGNVIKRFYPTHSDAFGELQDFLGIRLVDHSPGAEPTTPKGWVGGMLRAKGLDSEPTDPSVHLVRTDNNLSLWTMRDEYTRADENGNYAYFNVPFGNYLLRVSYGRMMGDTVRTLFLFPVDVQSSRQPYWINLEYESGSSSVDVKCPGFYSATLWSYNDNMKCWIEWGKYLARRIPPDNKVEYMDQYTFKNLPAGHYGVVAVRQVGNTVLTQRTQFELNENQHASCVLPIEPHSGILEGRVIGHQGDISDLRVIVRQAGAGPIQFATIYEASTRDSIAVIRGMGQDGRYGCTELPAGKYTVTAAQFPPGQSQYRRPVQQVSKLIELEEDQTTLLNFDLSSNTGTPSENDGR